MMAAYVVPSLAVEPTWPGAKLELSSLSRVLAEGSLLIILAAKPEYGCGSSEMTIWATKGLRRGGTLPRGSM